MAFVLYFLSYVSFLAVSLNAFPSILLNKDQHSLAKPVNHRNLDFDVHSISLIKTTQWWSFQIPPDINSCVSAPENFAIFISSNETILSNGACPLFHQFICSKPHCSQDTSTSYPQNDDPKFSNNEATRISLTEPISFGNGAWKTSSPVYLYDCKEAEWFRYPVGVQGQIGLGLSGQGYQSFQTPYPIFSFIFHSRNSGELIFGLNTNYTENPSTGIKLPCDLDWRMQVDSVSIGGSVLASSPVMMIFDIETSLIRFPTIYYSNLKDCLRGLLGHNACYDKLNQGLLCFYSETLGEPPILVFTLKDGTQFSVSIISLAEKLSDLSFPILFGLTEPTPSGVDYIVLGRQAMFQYYTVFQKPIGEDPTITLYPFSQADPVSQSNQQSNVDPSSPSKEGKDVSNPLEVNNASEPEPAHDPTITQSENAHYIPNDITGKVDKSEKPDNATDMLCFFIGIGFVVGIGLLIIYCWLKNRQIKEVGRQKATLELNESSNFVSSDDNSQYANDND